MTTRRNMRVACNGILSAHEETERAVARWHEVINAGDMEAAREAVADPIVVNGRKVGRSAPSVLSGWSARYLLKERQ